MSWTLADLPSLTGKTMVVTGANSGLGLHTTQHLASAGARVVMACRNAERAKTALEKVRRHAPGADVEVRALDLGDLGSVRDFAEQLTEPVDVLINNAGVMAIPYQETADGFETQFGVNFLGHFALTGRLLPRLLERPGARVVTESSSAHQIGRINFDDLQSQRRYQRWRVYGQSKLADLLFARELSHRAKAAGADLLSVAAHPGYAATNLQLVAPQLSGNKVEEIAMRIGNRVFGQSEENGAIPTVFAAVGSGLSGGEYVGPDGLFGARGSGAKPMRPSKAALDDDTARRLWEVATELTGVTFEELRAPVA